MPRLVAAEALRRADRTPDAVTVIALRATGTSAVDRARQNALNELCTAPLSWSEEQTGDCHSAHTALQLARIVDDLKADPDGAGVALLVATDPDGAVGAVVVHAAASTHPDADGEH